MADGDISSLDEAMSLAGVGWDDFDAAFLTIRPLRGWTSGKQNYWTADVEGWAISAPTVRELVRLLRAWLTA